MHGTLWNAIFTSSIGYVIDTLRFNNDVDVLYQLATVLEMRLNHEYWYQCTWQTNNINKRATSDRLDSWASRHSRGIELVFLSLDCFTVRLFHSATIFSTRLITRMKRVFWFLIFIYLFYFISFFFFFGGGGGGVAGHLLFDAAYWSQGRRGYFDVSNVALVCSSHVIGKLLCLLFNFYHVTKLHRNARWRSKYENTFFPRQNIHKDSEHKMSKICKHIIYWTQTSSVECGSGRWRMTHRKVWKCYVIRTIFLDTNGVAFGMMPITQYLQDRNFGENMVRASKIGPFYSQCKVNVTCQYNPTTRHGHGGKWNTCGKGMLGKCCSRNITNIVLLVI